jgi:16S rRNA A1518/A1519 N6-dimethyltransferase RsmA/KsgA/DIM1 with predicted DNA glycosylase/AP lyase activity
MIFAIAIVLLMFLAVVFVGAPYVPSHKATIQTALDILPLKKGDLIVDLGSGDGSFLIAAAKRGFKAVGYELNPVLCLVSYLRSLKQGDLVKIRLADFWLAKLPADTLAIFVFLAGPYMNRFAKKLDSLMVNRSKPLYVVSNSFQVPGLKSIKSQDGLHLYKLDPK